MCNFSAFHQLKPTESRGNKIIHFRPDICFFDVPCLHLKSHFFTTINTLSHTHPSSLTEKILRFLVYFDLFSYPLKKEEIFAYLGLQNDQTKEAELIINKLLSAGAIFQFGPFYTPRNDDSLAERREKGNLKAKQRMRTARRYSRLIASFPFVRGVLLSGSISKGYMSEKDDIDYLIITHPGRMWLVRTLLTVFKKVFLLNSYRNFCINYFVDSEHLRFPGDELYAATEVVFLIPTFGREVHRQLMEANTWVQDYYPDFRQEEAFVRDTDPWCKRLAERLLPQRLGDSLEGKLYRGSKRFIHKRYQRLEAEAFADSFTLTPFEIRYFPDHGTLDLEARFTEKCKSIKHTHPELFSTRVILE